MDDKTYGALVARQREADAHSPRALREERCRRAAAERDQIEEAIADHDAETAVLIEQIGAITNETLAKLENERRACDDERRIKADYFARRIADARAAVAALEQKADDDQVYYRQRDAELVERIDRTAAEGASRAAALTVERQAERAELMRMRDAAEATAAMLATPAARPDPIVDAAALED